MKFEKMNPWLTFVGNIAILFGLIAVAIEIRDNSLAVRSQELGALRELTQDRYLAMLSPELAAMYVKSLENPGEMTAAELWAMTNYVNIRVSLAQRSFRAYQDGIIDQADWESELAGLPLSLSTPLAHLIWQNLKEDYADSPDFVSAIENAINTNTVAPDDRWLSDLQEQARNLKPSVESRSPDPE